MPQRAPSRQARSLAAPSQALHAWERWVWLWHTLWFALLVYSTGRTLSEVTGYRWWLALGLAIAFGGWYVIMILRHPEYIHEKTRPILLYFAGAIALFTSAVALHPAYFFLVGGLYLQIFSFLRLRWALSVALGLTVLMVWLQFEHTGGGALSVWVIIIALLATAGGFALAIFLDAIIGQSLERHTLIVELERTRTELAAAERQAGVFAERQRLAREIHDTLAQGFSSMVLHLEAADQKLPAESSGVRWHLEQARRTGRESLAEARHLVWALQPEALESGSFTQALEQITRRLAEESGVSIAMTISDNACPLHPEIEGTLVRVVQEALTNVRKHAQAQQVRISVFFFDDLVTLDIHDDGVGFDPEKSGEPPLAGVQSGFGLHIMRQRATLLGGTFTMESAPGEGTTVAVTLPLQGRAT